MSENRGKLLVALALNGNQNTELNYYPDNEDYTRYVPREINGQFLKIESCRIGPIENENYTILDLDQPAENNDETRNALFIVEENQDFVEVVQHVPEKNLELRQEYIGNKMFQVLCYAEGVFPEPSMNLHIGRSEVNDSKIQVFERNGLFDIKATADIPSLQAPEEFSCELHIPQANYTVRKEAVYYPVSGGIPATPLFTLGALMVLFGQLFSQIG